MTTNSPKLGAGAYRLSEVARYTEVNFGRVWSWFRERHDRENHDPVFHSDYDPVEGDFAVSFLDMIDVSVAAQLREEGVKMSIVRRSKAILSRDLSTQHPFSHSDIYTDGQRVFVFAADQIGDETLSEVISHQQFFLRIRERLTHIEYSKVTKLAARWRIARGVVIDPRVALGKPVVANTGTTTFVLANCYWANDQDAGVAADLFNVSEEDVVNAVSFEQRFGGRRAA